MKGDGEPEATVVPFTVTVAWEFAVIGVTLIAVVSTVTFAVYEVVAVANDGDNAPLLNCKSARSALAVITPMFTTVVTLSPALLKAVTE